MNPPYLLEMRLGEPCKFNEFVLLRSVNSEESAIKTVKTLLPFSLKQDDNGKFRLYMGPAYGYKYFNLETETFEF